MTDRKPDSEGHDVLESNLEQLLTRAHQPPRISDTGRARILRDLKTRQRRRAVAPSPGWWGWLTARPGLVAAAGVAAIAVTVFHFAPSSHRPAAERHANLDPGPERVMLADGSEMILDRDAAVTVLGPRHLRLEHGEVLLDVAKGGGNFVVDAPHGRAVVLGTRFVIEADAEQTWAAVMRGRVRIENQVGAETLRPGEQGFLRDGKMPIRRAAPRLSHLTSWAKLARRQEEGMGTRPARRGTLLARNPRWQQQEFPLPLRDLTIDVHVDNQVARVAIDQTFFNPQQQQLEGVYRFALPPGAAISRQAMYVDGKRMESAIVERQRGRHIYEEIVYTNRDPALMEWMSGNLFKVRIFPLPARTEKRILISYTQSLERLYDDYRLEVPIPEVDNKVRSARYKVRLVDCPDCTVKSTSHAIETARDGNDTLVTFARDGYELGDDLILTIRDPATKPRVAAREQGSKRFYLARVKPTITAATAPAVARRWVILDDTSASRTPLERKAQSFLVDHFLREIDEDDQVAVLAFDTTVRQLAPDFQRVGDLSRRAVANFLTEQSADGVGFTDLEKAIDAATRLLASGGDGFAPHILYLGDGIATGGDRRIAALREQLADKAAFVGVGVGERVDANLLRSLAAASGGLFTTMNPGDDLGWRIFDLVASLNTPRVLGLQATLVDAGGAPLEGVEVYPSATQLADGEELSLVARLGEATPAAVVMTGSVAGQPWRQQVELPAVKFGAGAGYLPRLWAQRRIDSLISDDAAAHQKEITELGIDNFLITPFTSLLVLENQEMYRRFKVKENRKLGWAAYSAPAKIPVVHEPLDSAVVPDDVALDAVLLRTPLQVLQRYGYYGGLENGRHSLVITSSPGFADDWTVLRGLDGVTVTGALSRGDMGTLGHGAGSLGGGTGTGWGFGGEQAPVEELEKRAESAADVDGDDVDRSGELAPDQNEDMAQMVTTESLHREPTEWSARVGGGGGMRGRRSNAGPMARSQAETVLLDGEAKAGKFKARASSAYYALSRDAVRETRRRGRSRNHQGRYWGYYNSTPVPVAYNYATDPRFYDLTEFVPGFFADGFDVDRHALEQSSGKRRGSISKPARELIERARARMTPTRYRFPDGHSIAVDDRGHFRLSQRLDSGLAEELVFTGDSLYRLYPELGLAVRRDAGDASPLVHARWTPFVLPEPGALARWYDVTLTDPHTVRLGLGDRLAVEMVLDHQLRVVEVSVVTGDPSSVDAKRNVELTLEYRAGEVVMVRDGQRTVISVDASTGAPVEVDQTGLTLAEMPLHQPAYWNAKLAELEAGSAEWRYALHQRMASDVALGNTKPLWDALNQLAELGPLARGELVLAGRAIPRAENDKAVRALLAPMGDDPVAVYLETSFRYSHKQRATAFDDLAARDSGSLVGMLASYRSVLASMWNNQDMSRRDTGRRIEKFLAGYGRSSFGYVAVQMFASRWAWEAPKETAALWDAAAKAADPDGPWPTIIGYEAARGLYSAGKYDEAADRFEQLLSSAANRGFLPDVDQTVAWAFRNSSRGQAGWRLFWSRWRERVLREGDPEAVFLLLQSALVSGESVDVERIATRAVEIGVSDPDLAMDVIDLLYQSGRTDQAQALLTPLLATTDKPSPELLERASWVAEQQGRVAQAIDYLERAMAVMYAGQADLSAIRNDYGRLIGLYTRRVESAPAAERADLSARALGYAAEWRNVDPDNPQIDQLCARMLFGLGRPEDAWRYLSTAIERHPMEGTSFQLVADALESQGRIEEAEKLWQQAFEVEPLNPTWLLRRANALFALGHKTEGLALIDEITSFKDWHSRYRGVVYQAEAIEKRLK